jgi:hypothetical protein
MQSAGGHGVYWARPGRGGSGGRGRHAPYRSTTWKVVVARQLSPGLTVTGSEALAFSTHTKDS